MMAVRRRRVNLGYSQLDDILGAEPHWRPEKQDYQYIVEIFTTLLLVYKNNLDNGLSQKMQKRPYIDRAN